MGRFFRWAFALGVLGVIALACAFTMLIVMTGKSPGDAIRSLLARVAIAGRYDEINTPLGADSTWRRFQITFGDSPATIAANLAGTGVIADRDLFVSYARAEGLDVEFQAGTYFVRQTQTLAEIALRLTDARASHIPFRILEGWRIEQVIEAIDSNTMFSFSGADFLAAASNPSPEFAALAGIPAGANLEGFLFPGSYQLPPDITVTGLIETLTNSFLENVDANLRAQIAARGVSLRDIVSLAAITQREALHTDEMPLIAGVYQNRLDIGMKLDADPTVQYGLGNSRGTWWPQITMADYSAVASSYNTYINFGLPPGPIASPGLPAIRAAANPEPSDYYFFRADCRSDGYHDFGRTFEEHLANGC